MSEFDELLILAGLEEQVLNETKPARYNSHLDKEKSFANMSAERNNAIYEPVDGDTPKIDAYKAKMKQKQSEENNIKTEQLKKDIKELGLSYVKTYGAWNEKGKQTHEHSFLIPNITKEQALKLGKKYGQYSIIFKDKDDDIAYMYITLDDKNYGNVDMKFDMSKTNKFSKVNIPSEKEKMKNSSSKYDYSGYTGLKKNGKGYNLSYKKLEEE